MKEYRPKRQRAVREMIWAYLIAHPCVDCGEADPVVLDFDHVRGEKSENLVRLIAAHGRKKILDEIEKCEVRCANCHRRKTAVAQRNWKLRFS
jgi:hypothetical protein